MTLAQLQTELDKAGYPQFYGGPKEATKPPYIALIRPSAENVSSDYSVHGKYQDYIVELYTKKKDLVAEIKLEDILGSIDSDYETLETYIDTEKLNMVAYSITIFEKVGI